MRTYPALKNLYELEKTIGTGGFAKVKLARHILTGEKVAIKIMEKSCLGDDLPRVKRELEALKSLSHHHICKLFEVIETETHFFLIMEYCAGGELFDHIVQCNRLSEMESRSFFRQILSAVAYLHSKGFVHRDIKPENVLLDKEQCVKLIDFGLCAKPTQDSYLDTACGSPTYAAPELIKGDKYLGTGVDVWSMGVMLYALLCGCLPFDSEKIDTLYKQIVSGRYATPEHLSEGSKKLLQDMLQTDPEKRISVKELLSHPWVQLGYKEPVSFASMFKEVERDNHCLNTMALYFKMSAEELWCQLVQNHFDHNSATYQLLLNRKKQSLPLSLGQYVNRTALGRLQSMRRTVRGASSVSKGTYVTLPKRKEPPVADKAEKENQDQDKDKQRMQPPDNTPVRVLRKRPRSPRDAPPSPAPVSKRAAVSATRREESPVIGRTLPKVPNTCSVPSTPTQRHASPSARLFNSIERRMKSVRRVLTPKKRRSSVEAGFPTLLTAKNMCNVSTTSSSSPEYVKQELVKALNSRGIECKCKGFSVRGKMHSAGGKVCKLSFELEIVLIPTLADVNGSVVGILRKRIKGDSWNYKKVCEEVLNMADLK